MHASSQRLHVSPLSGAPLRGAVTVPGDKSIGHRAVLLGALGDGETVLRGLSDGEDNQRTVAVFAALGIPISREPGVLRLRGRGLRGLTQSTADLDCGNSGTSIRLLSGLLAAQPFASRMTGDPYLSARPMLRVVAPLRAMGAVIDGQPGKKAGDVYPPLQISACPPAGLRALRYESPIASAQVKSALLLAGLYADGETEVIEPTRSRDHSERMLRALGVPLRTFDLPDGRQVTFEDALGTSWEPYELGAVVPVKYDPGDPEDARIVDSSFRASGGNAVFLLFGGAFSLIGLLCVVFGLVL